MRKTLSLSWLKMAPLAAALTGLTLLWVPGSNVAMAATQVTVGDRFDIPITFSSLVPVGRIELNDISFTNAQLISLKCGGENLTVSESSANGCTVLAPSSASGAIVATATVDATKAGLIELRGDTTLKTLLGATVGGTISAPTYQAVAAGDNSGSGDKSTTTNEKTTTTTINSTTDRTNSSDGGTSPSSSKASSADEPLLFDQLVAGVKDSPWFWGMSGLVLLVIIIWTTWFLTARAHSANRNREIRGR